MILLLLTLYYLATSTSVERVFSQGCHLLSFTRNRLSAKSSRALLCFGSWSRADLITTTELISAIKTPLKRKAEVIEEEEDGEDGSDSD